MKLIIFDGTPQEYAAVAPLLHQRATEDKASSAPNVEGQEVCDRASPPAAGKYVSVDEALAILTRLPLSRNIRNVIQALFQAWPQRLNSTELRAPNGHNTDQFRAMMGAFARRVKTTAGEKKFFDQEWEVSTGQFTWTLPPAVRQGIERSGILDSPGVS